MGRDRAFRFVVFMLEPTVWWGTLLDFGEIPLSPHAIYLYPLG